MGSTTIACSDRQCGINTTVQLALFMLVLVAATTAVHAQKYVVLYNLGTNPNDPASIIESILAQGRDGALYSTSQAGGQHIYYGAVFKITPKGALTVLYSFTGGNDGAFANSGLTLGTNGSFYGTTSRGGTDALGNAFKITPGGNLTVLHSFGLNSDGANPFAVPVEGTDTQFYGTTTFGGLHNDRGTAYKMKASGTFTTLTQFQYQHGSDFPLAQGTDGIFYGTANGDRNTFGAVFKITSAGRLMVLYRFDGGYGAFPSGPLVQGRDGNFYGTTITGGGTGCYGGGCGVVFKITPVGQLTVVHSMNGTTDGWEPVGGLVEATDGNFYGVAAQGGNSSNCGKVGCGTIFRVSPQGTFSVLYNFDRPTGASPLCTLLQHTTGILYGYTYIGGTHDKGTFFSFDVGLGPFVSFLPPQSSGKVGKTIELFGQGLTGTTGVSFNGTAASFTVVSDTYLTARVPSGATTGFVSVTTPKGALTSNKKFRVIL